MLHQWGEIWRGGVRSRPVKKILNWKSLPNFWI